MYETLKLIHICAATLTILGFTLRGYWMLVDSPMLERRWVGIAPHAVDTVFLLSGVGLIIVLGSVLLKQPWLLAKFAALVGYILLGTIALKRGRTKTIRTIALVGALLTFAYIVGVALTKSLSSWAAMV